MNQREHQNDIRPDAAQLLQRYEKAVQAGCLSEVDAIGWELMALAGQQAVANPSPELLLQMEAQRCEAAADWKGAESAYRKLLDQAAMTGKAPTRFRAFADLSQLHQLVGSEPAALEQACSATAAARQADMPIRVAMALEQQAGCALRLDRVSEALTALDEALRSMGSERMYDIQRGRCFVLRAECSLRSGEALEAERDLETARQHLEVHSEMELAAGVHSAVARWWSVKARLQAEKGDWTEVALAWIKAVAGRRHVAELPQVMGPYTQNALAETLWDQGQALLSAGLLREGEEAMAESRAIRGRIGLPPLSTKKGPA
jgi:tetratricopeptide (TPR) repeat protein